MGIVVFPVLLAAFVAGVFTIVRLILFIKAKKIALFETVLGIVLSVVSVTTSLFYYSAKGEMNGVQYALTLPTLFIILPFITHFVLSNHDHVKKQFLSKVLLISTLFSFLLMLGFFNTFLELPEFLSVKITH